METLSKNASLEERMARVEGIMGQISERMNHLEGRFDTLEAKIESRFTQTENRFMKIESRIENRFSWTMGIMITMWVTIILSILFK